MLFTAIMQPATIPSWIGNVTSAPENQRWKKGLNSFTSTDSWPILWITYLSNNCLSEQRLFCCWRSFNCWNWFFLLEKKPYLARKTRLASTKLTTVLRWRRQPDCPYWMERNPSLRGLSRETWNPQKLSSASKLAWDDPGKRPTLWRQIIPAGSCRRWSRTQVEPFLTELFQFVQR